VSATRSARPELLAPAGDWDALRAAVANGADAVYFGLPRFNARHRATNFAPEDLPQVIEFLHAHNVRGYVAFNTLIFADELPEVVECLKSIADAGADAVIVQDLGLALLAKRIAPTLPVHASTQMTLTEPRGIEFARRELGIERVILARELSAADIEKVALGTSVPLEVFVHGALCVAYSGQCLTSEALGGRSANRGQCAQACRLPYEMVVDGRPVDLGERAYLLSPQDLAAYDLIEPLAKSGVVSFKIEGRLKSASYVAATTQTYRAAIDAAAPFSLTPQGRRDLEQCFSRGLTHGFLDGVNHQVLVQGRFPKSRGVRVGTVLRATRRGVLVELTDEDLVRPGDGVVFDSGKPERDEPGGRIYEVKSGSNQVELTFSRDFDPSVVPSGAIVWKTDDPALRQRLEHTFAGDVPTVHRTPLTLHVRASVGGPLEVTATDDAGRRAVVTWLGPLEAARKHPLTAENIREQFGRLVDTPFALAEVEVELTGDVIAPRSVLNDLRRQLVADLLRQRRAAVRHEVYGSNALDLLRQERSSGAMPTALRGHVFEQPMPTQSRGHGTRQVASESPRLAVLCRTLEQLDAALACRPALVYCDFEDLRRYHVAVERARSAGVPVGLATLRIQKPGEDGHLRLVAGCRPDVLLVRNLAGLDLFRTEFSDIELVGDFSLNVANDLTADLFLRNGLKRLTPSYDLNWEQFTALLRHSDAGRFETTIHQHMPMFHMEHCVFAAFLSEGKDWRDCGRPCDRHKVDLKDRVGAAFPVLADTGCRNTVFNSVPQSAAEFLPRMLGLGVRWFRVELLRESAGEVKPLLDRYAAVLTGRDDGRATWRSLKALNQLGVTRGTLQVL
jgi:putative protease